MDYKAVFSLLVLLVCVNGAPIIARKLLRDRFAFPLDGYLVLSDQRRLLGSSKTVRGLLAACAVGALLGPLLGLDMLYGALFGFAAMLGDSLASFFKRRLNFQPGDAAPVLDQVPEAALPVWLVSSDLALDLAESAAIIAGFFIVEVTLSPLLFWLRIRRRPF
ncbi:MAG: CDP-archaeol synthase [Gammaproteobacteria bacterium]|nr:CDP-archaeol synthase [Gammaproteobacteria bacterium]